MKSTYFLLSLILLNAGCARTSPSVKPTLKKEASAIKESKENTSKVETSSQQKSLDDQIEDLCNQIAIEMSEYKKTTIAVIEFSDLDGNVSDLGKFLSEEVITKLFLTKKFKVIERQLLNKVIKEQKLQVSGIVDEVSAKKLGKLLGVNAIVSGTVAELATSVKVNARLIGTETGEIFGAASVEISIDESIQKLLHLQSVVSGENQNRQPTQPKVNTQSTTPIEVGGFRFTGLSWKRDGDNIICSIKIENIGEEEKEIRIYSGDSFDGQSYIYDDFNNKYKVEMIGVGQKMWYDYFGKFPPGLPENISFIAKNVRGDTKSMTVSISMHNFKSMVVVKNLFEQK